MHAFLMQEFLYVINYLYSFNGNQYSIACSSEVGYHYGSQVYY